MLLTNQGPGSYGWVGDVCVPISRLAECITAVQEDIEQAGLTAPILGHVGDGNFHAIFLVYPDDEQGMKRAKEVNDRMIQLALKMGGSCSGEHGIGIGKIDMLRQQHGEGVAVMKAIKQALDPGNILNPTKVLG